MCMCVRISISEIEIEMSWIKEAKQIPSIRSPGTTSKGMRMYRKVTHKKKTILTRKKMRIAIWRVMFRYIPLRRAGRSLS